MVWSLLGNLNAQNIATTLNHMSHLHQELSVQMSEGSALAKSNKLMPIWLPIMDMIVTLPWLTNHSTSDALIYLNSHYPNQWSMYCQQTYEAILAPTADNLLRISQQWREWAHQLDSVDQNKNTVAQCFLMLQANEYFCDSLAKSAL